MRSRTLLVAAVVGALLATTMAPAGAIFGIGVDVADRDTPEWIVRIDGRGGCTGTLIDHEYVLTAAHCLVDDSGNLEEDEDVEVFIQIPAGQNGRTESELDVRDFEVHPDYRVNPQRQVRINDVGLIRLAEFAPLATDTLPVGSAQVGDDVDIFGYGFGGNIPMLPRFVPRGENQLRTLEGEVVGAANCSVASLCLVVAEGDFGICQGDSGGPAVRGGEVRAVVSGGAGGGRILDGDFVPAICQLGGFFGFGDPNNDNWVRRQIASWACNTGLVNVDVDLSNVNDIDEDANIVMLGWGESPSVRDDVIIGTVFDDFEIEAGRRVPVDGLRGDDTLCGRQGNDRLSGGSNADVVLGGSGADILSGNNGQDAIYGGPGNDVLNGGRHDDELSGNEGFDTLNGNNGFDDLSGGSDNDVLIGHRGDDTLNGGPGTDTLDGRQGSDTCTNGPNLRNC